MSSAKLKALKKHGLSKHLSMLVEDLYVEYQDTVERTRQEQEGTYETPLCYTIPDEEKNKELWEAPPVKDFDPPYLRGGVEGRQMAKAIGTKRTPIGNLHTTSNPALYLPVVPSTNIVLSKAGTPMNAGADKPPTPAPPSAPPSAGSGFARQPKHASWVTPQQRGDRVEGMKMAKIMNAKRTPLGGFFYPDKQ